MPFNIERNIVTKEGEIIRSLIQDHNNVPLAYLDESEATKAMQIMYDSEKRREIYNPKVISANRRWGLVSVANRSTKSHSLWRASDTDQISFCDQSGGNPSSTDDGPLFIIPGATIEASIFNWIGDKPNMMFKVPVDQERDHGKEAYVHCELAHIKALRELDIPMKVKMSNACRYLWKQLKDVNEWEMDFTK